MLKCGCLRRQVCTVRTFCKNDSDRCQECEKSKYQCFCEASCERTRLNIMKHVFPPYLTKLNLLFPIVLSYLFFSKKSLKSEPFTKMSYLITFASCRRGEEKEYSMIGDTQEQMETTEGR